MAYEHKEGRGTIFPNGYKTEDKHPDHKGKCLWNGELIELSLWDNETEDGETRFGFCISKSKPKDGNGSYSKPDRSPKPPQRKFTPDDDPLPF